MAIDGLNCEACGAAVGAPFDLATRIPMRDAGTGLLNGALLLEAAEPVLALARRNARTMAFLHVHVDGLDGWTRSVSESRRLRILRGVAERLLRVVRDSDFVARTGPESFGVVLTEVWEPDAAVRVAHRLVRQMGGPDGRRAPIRVRVGVAFFPSDGASVGALLGLATDAATRAGRDGIGIGFADDAMGRAALRRAGLEHDLGGDGVADEFVLHYQPVFSMATGEAVGVEALLRWEHARQGLLPASSFIPLAERTGRIRALDQWALGQALRDSRRWQAAGWLGWVSVNVSGRTLSDPRLEDAVTRELAGAGVEPSSLVLEVTESAALAREATTVLGRLRDRGVWVAIDDFGTGYASFEYLREFEPDLVKLDRLFVPDNDGARHRRLIQSLVSMAHHMGTPVVVEGVEEEAQWERLRDSGCDMLQGYLFGRPMPADDFAVHHLARKPG